MNVTATQTAGQDSLIDRAISGYLAISAARAQVALARAPAVQQQGLANVSRANQVGAVPGQASADSEITPEIPWKPIAIVVGVLIVGVVALRMAR